jgi:hypothetical protein
MTETQFQELSFYDRGIVLFTEGTFMLMKSTDSYNISLYSLYGMYVEVAHSKKDDKIKSIELVSSEARKLFYQDIQLSSEH